MVAAVPNTDETASERAQLLGETTRALDTLALAVGSDSVLNTRAKEVVGTTIADVRHVLDRSDTTVALLGERDSGAILDAWLGETVFGEVDVTGVGPLIALRPGPEPRFRVVFRDGTSETFEASKWEASRARPAGMQPPMPTPAAPVVAPSPVQGLVARLVAFLVGLFRALFGGNKTQEAAPSENDPPFAALIAPGEHNGSSVRAEFVARVRELVDTRKRGADVLELWITHPVPDMDEAVALLDLRGVMSRSEDEAWALVRGEIDTCIVVLDEGAIQGVPESAIEIARDLSTRTPHVWVATALAPKEAAATLGIDVGRLICVAPPFRAVGLAERILDARALTVGVRAIAALRLAQGGLDELLTQEETRDREIIERIGSYAYPSEGRRRDETRRRVGGAVAGRAIRVLQNVLSVLETELNTLREDRLRAVAAARSIDEVKAEVSAVGPVLRALREKLASYAESLVYEAMSNLWPSLLADLERRVEGVEEDLELTTHEKPVWPPAPELAARQDGLVAHDTLVGGEALKADIRWADTLLRSLEKVKQRCAQQLAQDVDRIAHAAQAEILAFEPKVARRLHEALETWMDAAADAFNAWLSRVVEAERAARDAARTQRQAPMVAQRDALAAHGIKMASWNRALAVRARTAA